MDIDHLSATARILYGDDWQRALARGLGPLHPDGARDSIDARLVRRWAAGERPVPDWVQGALIHLLEEVAIALEERAGECRREAQVLQSCGGTTAEFRWHV